MMKNVLLIAVACWMLALQMNAQSEVFNIGNGDTYNGCNAIMHDSNGGLQPYSPSSNNQTTICPGVGETQVNLYFLGFDVSAGDQLSIYDGNSTAAPLIGTYSGTTLLFQTISPTAANTSGCLTVTFTSNADANVGDFSIRIICGVPCSYPIADMYTDADTMKICPGESVEFYGGNSTWTPGANLDNWLWDFGDGTVDSTTWSVVQHQFNEPGGYRVRLYLQDDNGCSSLNIPEVVILVSTPYVFDVTVSDDYFCIGNPVLLGTQAFIDSASTNFGDEAQNGNSVTWIENNSLVFDNGVYIPDNQGCLYADILFNQFGTATITSADDFSNIYFSIEHSFVGDITISIICPDGSVMSIFPEAGGAGTFLGEPIDIGANDPPGVGYLYSFSPNSTGGTWMDLIATSAPTTIPAGDYAPEGSFADLIGCPLNGTWQLEVCDIVSADDGYVFEFGIQFAPQFYPNPLQFTPTVGAGCDSSAWIGNVMPTTLGPDCDWAIFDPTEPGVYNFQYQVTNDFGCTFTDEVTVTAVAPPVVNASDIPLCVGQTNQLNAVIENAVSTVTYTYQWSPATGLSNATIASPVVNAPNTYSVVVSAVGLDNCSGTDAADVVPVAPLVTTDSPQYNCFAIYPVTLTSAPQVNPDATFSWYMNDDILGGEVHDSLVVSDDAHYQLIVNDAACNTADTVDYYIAPPLVIEDRIMKPCVETLPVDIIADDQNQSVVWDWSFYPSLAAFAAGNEDTTFSNALQAYTTETSGVYLLHVQQAYCQNSADIIIRFEPEECEMIIPNIMTPDGDGRNDTFEVTSIRRYPGSSVQIFNRWGTLIFEDLDYNGKWNGDNAADGTYYYIVGLKKNTGVEYFRGDLTIVRKK